MTHRLADLLGSVLHREADQPIVPPPSPSRPSRISITICGTWTAEIADCHRPRPPSPLRYLIVACAFLCVAVAIARAAPLRVIGGSRALAALYTSCPMPALRLLAALRHHGVAR